MKQLAAVLVVLTCIAPAAPAAEVLVEAEGFASHGGWVLDPQFMDVMGSPYLLAHGLGKPVANASTDAEFPATGVYRLWVRTKDWVPSHHPGVFKVLVAGHELPLTFGNQGEGWLWQDGGTVEIKDRRVKIELKDLTGFDGRCDALYFTSDQDFTPPAQPDAKMAAWRRKLLGLPETPPSAGEFDLVVVGGGIPGCSAALAASRLGLNVALIHNRPVLGGNGSPEIGITLRGKGRTIVDEVARANRDQLMAWQPTLKLFLNWHAFRVQKSGDRIASVDAKHTSTSRELRFAAPMFIDCTGMGAVGYLAGAEYRMGREAASEFNESLAPEKADKLHHGNSPIFRIRSTPQPSPVVDAPWALAVAKDYSDLGGQVLSPGHDNHGGGLTHFWEYGQFLDPFADAEHIRDHLLCAVYGSYINARQKNPRKYGDAELEFVGHIVATGESRRLMGDYILTENDIRGMTAFPDTVATNADKFCLHYPGTKYDFRLGDWKWITAGEYSVPFRCLYSKNVENLMMAGKHISVTHIAGSSTKTMLNGGQHGVAVGAAAFLCKKYNATPRGVGKEHVKELQDVVLERGEYRDTLKARRK